MVDDLANAFSLVLLLLLLAEVVRITNIFKLLMSDNRVVEKDLMFLPDICDPLDYPLQPMMVIYLTTTGMLIFEYPSIWTISLIPISLLGLIYGYVLGYIARRKFDL